MGMGSYAAFADVIELERRSKEILKLKRELYREVAACENWKAKAGKAEALNKNLTEQVGHLASKLEMAQLRLEELSGRAPATDAERQLGED